MAGGKFNSSLFGQHLLSKATGGQKENTVGSSQLFAAGFSKFIGDGADNNKVDPSQLPLKASENQTIRGLLGSPGQFLKNKQLSGAGSYKSGFAGKNNDNGSTDETNSIN